MLIYQFRSKSQAPYRWTVLPQQPMKMLFSLCTVAWPEDMFSSSKDLYSKYLFIFLFSSALLFESKGWKRTVGRMLQTRDEGTIFSSTLLILFESIQVFLTHCFSMCQGKPSSHTQIWGNAYKFKRNTYIYAQSD